MKQPDRWGQSLLLLAALLILVGGLGARGLWGSEGRWAEITRTMILSGDYTHPTIDGEAYFDKPLLTYWVIALLARASGVLNEFVTRLPSALAGLAAVWATLRLGQRLWSPAVGWTAAVILLTSYGFLFWSRTAAADSENLAAVILAVAWYWHHREKPGFVAFLVFYLIIFLGALMKGLPAIVVSILAVMPDMLRGQRWKALFTVRHFLALGVGLLVYGAPFAYASMTQPATYQESGLGMVFRENIVRFFKPFDHRGPVYLYLYALPLLLLPWVPLFLGGLVQQLRSWKTQSEQTRWLLTATGVIFLFFTLSGSRRDYYILPLLPLCALLMAVVLESGTGRATHPWTWWGLSLQRVLLVAGAVLCACAPLGLPFIRAKTGFIAPPWFGVACLVVGLAALTVPWFIQRALRTTTWCPVTAPIARQLVMAMILMAGMFCWLYTLLDEPRTERRFALQLKETVASYPPERRAFYRNSDARIVFYLGSRDVIPLLHDAAELKPFLDDGRPGVLITQVHQAEFIPAELRAVLDRAVALEEPSQPWESASNRSKKWRVWLLPAKDSSVSFSSTGGEGIL